MTDNKIISRPKGEEGRPLFDIGCLNSDSLRATLVSTAGSHCEVWRAGNRKRSMGEEDPSYREFVLKYPLSAHSMAECRTLGRHYAQLKTALEDIVPEALFFITRINGEPNICVVAEAVNIWFNIANPQNCEEAVALLKAHPRARDQLSRFVATAKMWRVSDNPRLIDLYGIDNLVMDVNREIRYVDSFYVFFFEDMLELLQDEDPKLETCISSSLAQLAYLEGLLEGAGHVFLPK